jgi:hypothetical protein
MGMCRGKAGRRGLEMRFAVPCLDDYIESRATNQFGGR